MTNRLGLFLFILLSIFVTSNISAQKGLRLGFSLTPSTSRASMLDLMPEGFGRRSTFGIGGGAMAQYGLSSGIALHTGFLMNSLSFTVLNDNNPQKDNIKGTVTNFEIPVGFYLRQPLSRQSFMRELVGISVLSNRNKNDIAYFRYPEDNPFALQTVINNRISYTVNIGVEFMRELENGHVFTVGILYKRGLGNPMSLNVFSDASNNAVEPFEMSFKSGYIGLNFSFLFNLSEFKSMKEELYFE